VNLLAIIVEVLYNQQLEIERGFPSAHASGTPIITLMRTQALASHKSMGVLSFWGKKLLLSLRKWLILLNICRNTRIFSHGPTGGSFHFIRLSGILSKSIVWENGLKI
jgi:hypothetical protein